MKERRFNLLDLPVVEGLNFDVDDLCTLKQDPIPKTNYMNLAAALEIAALKKQLREAERVLHKIARDETWEAAIWIAERYFERKRRFGKAAK